MHHFPRIKSLQFAPSIERTVATQLLLRSIRDALSGISNVPDSVGAVTLESPTWVPGWHAPLLMVMKDVFPLDHDDTHDLHRLVDELFRQLQERMISGTSGSAEFKMLLSDLAENFHRAHAELL